ALARFPALRQMASRQVVLLTPLESFHPRPLPSRYRINRVHPAFCKKQPFYFQALAGCPFCKSFPLLFINGMGGWGGRISQTGDLCVPLSLLDATLTRHPVSVHSKGLTGTLTL